MKSSLLLLLTLAIFTIGFSFNPVKEYTMTPETFELDCTEHPLITIHSCEENVWFMKLSEEVNHN